MLTNCDILYLPLTEMIRKLICYFHCIVHKSCYLHVTRSNKSNQIKYDNHSVNSDLSRAHSVFITVEECRKPLLHLIHPVPLFSSSLPLPSNMSLSTQPYVPQFTIEYCYKKTLQSSCNSLEIETQ